MSESDSFVQEVTEEVRRDQLYKYVRRYGWIAALVVVALVGGAAYNEYTKSQRTAANEAAGDALLAALNENDAVARASATASLEGDDPREEALLRLTEAAALVDAGQESQAVAVLRELAGNADTIQIYGDLARLKAVMLDPDADWAVDEIEVMTEAGRPFRLLALEQRAIRAATAGDRERALADLTTIIQDTTVTPGLRERAGQLILALGGELPDTPTLLAPEGNG